MNYCHTLLIFAILSAGCDKGENQAKAEAEKVCELHHQTLKDVSGYAAGPDLMVSPEYGAAEFNTQFGDRYPNTQRVALSSSKGDGWTEATTVEVCEECQREYTLDFANYLKIDEKERWDQYMDFLIKNRPAKRDAIQIPVEGEELQEESILPPP